MADELKDMIDAQNQEDYHLPGGAYVKAIDPLVDQLLDSGFFGGGDFLVDEAIRSELEEKARRIIQYARSAVKEGFPVDVLDYRIETAMHHLPFKEQKEIRKEFEMATPVQSIRSIPIF